MIAGYCYMSGIKTLITSCTQKTNKYRRYCLSYLSISTAQGQWIFQDISWQKCCSYTATEVQSPELVLITCH